MDQKLEFAVRSLKCANFSELCEEYGISRKTGYKWKKRFLNQGIEGMHEQSRRPNSHSAELSEHVVCDIIRLKNAHLKWGPKKIQKLYERLHPTQTPPSLTSFKRVLERAGLTNMRKRRKRGNPSGRLNSGSKADGPNDVWTVDFKGWWLDSQGLRVEPLTVRDEYSRKVLEVRRMKSTRTEEVRCCFERLFEIYGLPKAIRSDNGSPFAASNSLLGLSRLSVWWLSLGINLERGRPGKPQDNGAHERMHLDILKELQLEGKGYEQQQLDEWRHEFNHVRPHETLNMDTPASRYCESERRYAGTPEAIDYGDWESRKVSKGGTIKYRNEVYPLTTALKGCNVGLKYQRQGPMEVWFAHLLIGHLDPATASFEPVDSKT